MTKVICDPTERRTNKLKNKILLDWIYHETDYFDVVFPAPYDMIMQNHWAFATEKIIERYLAILSKGGLTFIDADGYDYTDRSDAKTFCTTEKPKNNRGKYKSVSKGSHRFIITNVVGKAGALRAMCACTQKFTVHYFYIPGEDIKNMYINRGSINGTYNAIEDTYNKIEKYRVADVYELVKASPTYKPKPYVRSIEGSPKLNKRTRS